MTRIRTFMGMLSVATTAACLSTEPVDSPQETAALAIEAQTVQIIPFGDPIAFERGLRLDAEGNIVHPEVPFMLTPKGPRLSVLDGEEVIRDRDQRLRVGDRVAARNPGHLDVLEARATYTDGEDLVVLDLRRGVERTFAIDLPVHGTVAASDGSVWAQVPNIGFHGQLYARVDPSGEVTYVELVAPMIFGLLDVRDGLYLIGTGDGEVYRAQ